jgi:hypothetical protein
MHQHASMTTEQAKSAAKNIKSRLKAIGVELSMGHAYEALAGSRGYANWSTMKADMEAFTRNGITAKFGSCDSIEALKEKLREAIVSATKNRKSRHLYLDIKSALWRTLEDATADTDTIGKLTGPFLEFIENRGDEASRAFTEAFRVFLGKQLIPEVGDAISHACANDAKGYIAKTLIGIELLLVHRVPYSERTALSPVYARPLLAEELTFEDFAELTESISKNGQLVFDQAHDSPFAIEFVDGAADVKDLSSKFLSITHILRYGARLAYDMFMAERGELMTGEMSVFRRDGKAIAI